MRAILALVFMLSPATAAAQSAQRETIVPESARAIYDEYHFAPAVRAGDYVFVSGTVASLRQGESGAEGQEAALDRAFGAIARTLAAAGASWADVVDMTSYHTDLPAQADLFRRVKDRYLEAPYPAWTAIDIDRLWPDAGFVEIRVVAYRPRTVK